MRAVIVSHAYVHPAARGKLRALAGQGAALAVAVPARWTPPDGSASIQTPFAEDGGVRMVPVPTAGREPDGAPAAWRSGALRRLLMDFRPDIVQVEEDPSLRVSAAVTRLARQLGIPAVAFTKEGLPRKLPLLARLRRRRTLSRASGVVGANAVAAGLIRLEYPGLAWTSIPQLGLPVPRALAVEPHPPLAIGFVGRLVPEKGLDILLRACARLYGAWTLTVAGTGPAQEELEALAERLGVASRVAWLGAIPRPELTTLWPRLDCLVAPSRTTARWVETYPVQVLEAMGYGVTVVTSDSGALPETVGGAGLVFREDHPDGLTEALARLIGDASLRERLAAEGRRRVIAEYVDDAIARKTLAFWRVVRDAAKA
ncbi:MAG TPA: glycosyltransferase family 4 protein [Gemmatimonadales bacterium]|nr:glycosyltransferase family 4 protein [Gemmatimonadales bacterium]